MADERDITELPHGHPVAVALRRQMKGDYINAVSHVPAADWGWDEAQLMMFGSTLMHQLHYIDNIDFPHIGLRVSDIDFTARLPDANYDESYAGKTRKHIGPVLKQGVVSAGFDLAFEEEGKKGELSELWDKEKIAALDPSNFNRDFHVYRVFSPEDVIHRMQMTDRADVFREIISDEGLSEVNVKVRLSISPHLPNPATHIQPMTFLLEPAPLYPGAEHSPDGRMPLYHEQVPDLLAGKIVRTMRQGERFKPTDLLDIYNLCNSEPPLFSLNPDGPAGNDLETLRVLVITYLADAGIREPYNDNDDLLRGFRNTPENRQRFIKLTADEIAQDRMPDEQTIGKFFDNATHLLEKVFHQRSVEAFGSLNYTENDVRFATALTGKDPEEVLHPKTPSWTERVGKDIRNWLGKKEQPEYVKLPEPEVKVEYLKQEYPEVFKRHPNLARHIERCPSLGALKEQVREERMGAQRWGADL